MTKQKVNWMLDETISSTPRKNWQDVKTIAQDLITASGSNSVHHSFIDPTYGLYRVF